jgi:hypothetical protein
MIASHLYWPDRHWSFLMVPDAQHEFEFVSKHGPDCVGFAEASGHVRA